MLWRSRHVFHLLFPQFIFTAPRVVRLYLVSRPGTRIRRAQTGCCRYTCPLEPASKFLDFATSTSLAILPNLGCITVPEVYKSYIENDSKPDICQLWSNPRVYFSTSSYHSPLQNPTPRYESSTRPHISNYYLLSLPWRDFATRQGKKYSYPKLNQETPDRKSVV